MEIKEVIQAKIEVLENIGGYSIEVGYLKTQLNNAKSIICLQNESYKAGYLESNRIAKIRRKSDFNLSTNT